MNQAVMTSEPLVSYTLFEDVQPTEKIERADVPWGELAARIKNAATYIDKAHCPLISLSEYGENFSEKGCIRHSGNVKRIFGVELDYDGEQMPLALAVKRLQEANLQAILYTSPSHRPDRPRWRVLMPLSEPEVPAKRAEFVGRANRILGGVASRESFTLSQSFYIGRVRGAEYEVAESEGRFIDQAAEIEPQYFFGRGGNGEAPRDPTTDADLRAAFEQGHGRYEAMLKLSARWAARGMGVDDIESALVGLFANGDSKNADGIDLRTRIRPMAESAVKKYGETRRPVTVAMRVENGWAVEAAEAAHAVDEACAMKFGSLEALRETPVPAKVALVKDLLYPGAWLVVGRPKIGKSWLLLQLALAVAENGSFLGFPCQSADLEVLCVFGEDDDARIQSRLAALGVASAPRNSYVINQQMLFALAKRFAEQLTFAEFLQGWLSGHPKVRLVIVDTETTVRQVWAGERGQDGGPRVTETDYKQTRTFDEIALRLQIVVALVNHASKRKGEWTDIHELINRANTALAGASGSIALADPPDADPFDPKQKTRVLGIRGRDLKADLLLAVHQREDMPYFVSDGEYAEVRQTQVEAQIMEALEELTMEVNAGEYVTTEDLSTSTGKSRGTVKRTVTRMLAKGRTTWKKSRLIAKRGKGGGLRLDPFEV